MSGFKIIHKEPVKHLDIKRFHHGYEFEEDCPQCKEHVVWGEGHPGGRALNYPDVGKPFEIDMYCDECGHEWSREVLITIKIEAVDESA
jgi:hypothetical protein